MTRLWIVLFLLVGTMASAQDLKSGDMNGRGLTESDFPRVIELTPNVFVYEMITGPFGNARFTTNSLFVVTRDGVLVADGQGNPASTARLVEEIRKRTSQPIRYVVIGSDHGDHTNGNVAFPDTATFIAHPISQRILQEQAAATNRPANAPNVVVPTEVVSDRRVITMGEMEIQILHLGRAHAGGDLVVYLPRLRLLWMSEVYGHQLFPSLRRGFPTEWIEAIRKAERMDVGSYVPAHGFIDDRTTLNAGLPDYRKALEAIVAQAKRLYKPGAAAEEAFARADFSDYQSWTYFAEQGRNAFQRAWDELDGKLLPAATVSAQDAAGASANKVQSFDHLVINVADMERALAFYKRLGFALINESGWRSGKGQVAIRIGDNQKINVHREEPLGPQAKRQAVGADDAFSRALAPVAGGADFCVVWGGTIEEARQHVRALGIATFDRRVDGARGPASSVYFRDPDGNLWEFIVYDR